MWALFAPFTVKRHFLHYVYGDVPGGLEDVVGSVFEERIKLSSANVARRVESWVGRSAVYTE